jgi:hypothetical protein
MQKLKMDKTPATNNSMYREGTGYNSSSKRDSCIRTKIVSKSQRR